MLLTERQEHDRAAFNAFAHDEIAPHADRWDQEERLPPGVVKEMASRGYLGALVPEAYGGAGMDQVTFGLLNEAVGAECSSVRSVLTVHSMVAHAILRWGTEEQKARWLPVLASGERVGAFALSEPETGSDAASLRTTATRGVDGYVLNGRKRWITYGQAADLFLVFARIDGQVAAFLVEPDSGFETTPMQGLLGTRASLLAEIRLHQCRLPTAALLGRVGFGLTAVAASALDVGRYSVAWGCVGLAQSCVEASVRYTGTREQFGKRLAEHQLIQRLIADMVTNVTGARLLCHRAGTLKDGKDKGAMYATWMAKYFASTTAFKAASDAVQIHGANGCSPNFPVSRQLRDAKVMEIIEGSNQIQQLMIAQGAYQEYGV